MKKKILSFAVIAMLIASLFILTGCASKDDTDDEKSENDEVQNVAENIYNNAVEANDETSDHLKTSSESKWSSYEGEQTGTKVQSLLNLVVTESKASDNDDIEVEFDGETYNGSTEIAKCRTKVASAKKYQVSFEFEDDSLVKVIIK